MALAGCRPPLRRPSPLSDKLDPALRQALAAAPAGETRTVLVDLVAQVDLRALARRLGRQGAARQARRAAVTAALVRLAVESQAALRPFLDQAQRQGTIARYEGFAVIDRLVVVATPAGIAALAARPEVARIVAQTTARETALAWEEPPVSPVVPAPPERTSWALAAIGAEEAWRRGLSGRGVVVGAIDSGASPRHEQLQGNFRGGDAGWLDPAGGGPPHDTRFGHGTGVLSCAVGQNVAGKTLGVAPGAQWIACAGLPEGHYDNVLFTRCADWMLRVGRPDVLINAWLLPGDPGSGCDRSLVPLFDALRAAEILPVFAAGNLGPAPASNRSPANYADLFPGASLALSVGGLRADGTPFARSSRGPSQCGGAVFPVLAAPAEDLVAAFPLSPGTYLRAQGTSFAAGYAAGAAALLLESRPEASVPEIEAALAAGAVGRDRRLSLPGALARLREPFR